MFSTQLAQRAAENNPIRVGIIGAGKFGAGLVAQLSQMQGMVASAIPDINIEKAEVARTESLLPLGLSDNAKLKCDVSQGEAISYDMVTLDEDSFVLKLRRLQDATV